MTTDRWTGCQLISCSENSRTIGCGSAAGCAISQIHHHPTTRVHVVHVARRYFNTIIWICQHIKGSLIISTANTQIAYHTLWIRVTLRLANAPMVGYQVPVDVYLGCTPSTGCHAVDQRAEVVLDVLVMKREPAKGPNDQSAGHGITWVVVHEGAIGGAVAPVVVHQVGIVVD
jgi:hypothetical protein